VRISSAVAALQFFPVCSPGLFNQGVEAPKDLARHCLLHDDQDGKTWTAWLTSHAGDQRPNGSCISPMPDWRWKRRRRGRAWRWAITSPPRKTC
jgi:hypothetical protein